ncbi:MAG: high-affinity branched-chain amino acid ABC transporter permease LivH [Mycobacteriales bacterium]
MAKLVQLILAGLVSGAIYSLIATGYAVLYTATGFVNFALGAQSMLAGYLAYIFFPGQPLVVRVLISVVVSALLAVASWSLLYRWAAKRDLLAAVIMSFGFSVILEELVRIKSGSASRPAPTPFGRGVHTLGPLSLSNHSIGVLVVSGLLFLALIRAFASRRGTAVRAMFQDAEMAEVLGIRTRRITNVLFAVSGVFAAVAGILAAPILSLSPFIGLNLALIGFVGAVLGGLGRVSTAIAGGLLLGLLEAGFAGYVSADFRSALVYLVFVVVLIVRPVGLLGRVARVKV